MLVPFTVSSHLLSQGSFLNLGAMCPSCPAEDSSSEVSLRYRCKKAAPLPLHNPWEKTCFPAWAARSWLTMHTSCRGGAMPCLGSTAAGRSHQEAGLHQQPHTWWNSWEVISSCTSMTLAVLTPEKREHGPGRCIISPAPSYSFSVADSSCNSSSWFFLSHARFLFQSSY